MVSLSHDRTSRHSYLNTRVHVADPLEAELFRLQTTRQDHEEQVEVALCALLVSLYDFRQVQATNNSKPTRDQVDDIVERLY